MKGAFTFAFALAASLSFGQLFEKADQGQIYVLGTIKTSSTDSREVTLTVEKWIDSAGIETRPFSGQTQKFVVVSSTGTRNGNGVSHSTSFYDLVPGHRVGFIAFGSKPTSDSLDLKAIYLPGPGAPDVGETHVVSHGSVIVKAEPQTPKPDPSTEPVAGPIKSTSAVMTPHLPREKDYDGVSHEEVVVNMIFPVLGKVHWSDTFLANRDGGNRRHHGQDLMAPKMTPLVAVFDGVVYPATKHGMAGYSITLKGDNGWTATYMHINIDTPGTKDAAGLDQFAFAPGIYKGTHVVAGQHIGFVGDSGNARGGASHCHFELTDQDGAVLNAAFSLTAAEVIEEPLPVFALAEKPTKDEIRYEGFVNSVDPVARAIKVDIAQRDETSLTKVVAIAVRNDFMVPENVNVDFAALKVGTPISILVNADKFREALKITPISLIQPVATPRGPNSTTIEVSGTEAIDQMMTALNAIREDEDLPALAESGKFASIAEDIATGKIGGDLDEEVGKLAKGYSVRVVSGESTTMPDRFVKEQVDPTALKSAKFSRVGIAMKNGKWVVILASKLQTGSRK